MTIIKSGGYTPPDSNEELRKKRQQIVEDERIRILGESLMAFYSKLLEKYELVIPYGEDISVKEIQKPSNEEIEEFAMDYAKTKPIGF